MTSPAIGSRAGRLGGPLIVGGLTLVAAVAVVAAFAVAGRLSGTEFKVFSKDPVETLEVVYYVGYLAHAVMLVWWAGATAALLSGVALRAAGHRQASLPLLVGGALTTLLVLDDVFLLHENIYPRLGIPEGGTYVLYGLLTAAYAWSWRRRLGANLVLLAGAYAFWIAAACFEFVQEEYGIFTLHLGEDGCKAVGVALWAAFMIRLALVELLAALRAAPATTADRLATAEIAADRPT
ncbi:MAG: hypothetical protein ACT4RN_11855 [Pseudonocardia sp.]